MIANKIINTFKCAALLVTSVVVGTGAGIVAGALISEAENPGTNSWAIGAVQGARGGSFAGAYYAALSELGPHSTIYGGTTAVLIENMKSFSQLKTLPLNEIYGFELPLAVHSFLGAAAATFVLRKLDLNSRRIFSPIPTP